MRYIYIRGIIGLIWLVACFSVASSSEICGSGGDAACGKRLGLAGTVVCPFGFTGCGDSSLLVQTARKRLAFCSYRRLKRSGSIAILLFICRRRQE